MDGLVALLAVQAMVFVLWAAAMFRTLFRLRRRAVAESGIAFPGPGATLRSFRAFLTEPEFAADRRRLGWLTAALVALIAASTLWHSG